jgi:peptidoglycan/xylan/chitin deacetylase (PgdA/CDA1 family)
MWKEVLLSSYYYTTLPSRRSAATLRTTNHREPVQILFYHRVADDHPNDWTMSTRSFARQIRWLRSRFDIVTLSEAQSRISSGRNQRPTACITFDDGYADNRRFAIPLLLNHRVPFTYFVSTNHVLGGESFPHDVAAGHPLPVNTLAHLREMAAAGVEIGAHTRSHANLGADLTREEMVDEIAGSKRELEAAIGNSVRYFAFPYGKHENLSNAAFRVAFEAGFDGVCSAYGGYNFPGNDAFHLRRFHADCEFIRFKNWLTVDPRKLRNHTEFESGDFRAQSGGESRRGAGIAEPIQFNEYPPINVCPTLV